MSDRSTKACETAEGAPVDRCRRVRGEGKSRRDFLTLGGGVIGAVAAGRVVGPGVVRRAWAAGPLRPAVLVYGVPTLDVTAAFFSTIPQALGYYRAEGIEVDVQTVSGASAAVNLMTRGQAQFSSHGTAGLLQAVEKGAAVKGFICQIPDYFVSIAVLRDSPITAVGELKGKTIGVNAVGGAPDLVMHAVAQKQGWAVGKDVEFLAVGAGLPALDALRKGRVQALALWDAIFVTYEFVGAQFRFFRPDPLPSLGFTHASNALVKTIEGDPALVTAMARAQAKSIVFMAAVDPAELTRLHYKTYPATKPTGMSDADAVREGVAMLKARAAFMRYKQRVFDRTERLGSASDQEIASMRDLLVSGKQLKVALPPSAYFTSAFLPAMNDFDFAPIVDAARKFKV
jgi:ABC-type nitrate/sulfonate/bicarbonate transport system substrate-binding protein